MGGGILIGTLTKEVNLGNISSLGTTTELRDLETQKIRDYGTSELKII